MVNDILKGAIRVLEQQGGRLFTTIRVAEETGISVGSLYQYFPNKESILFQIQHREWEATSGLLLAMMADRRYSPAQRLRRTIHAFFRSEAEEATLRKALVETGVSMDDLEHFIQLKEDIFSKTEDFLAEIKSGLTPRRRRFLARFIFTTISSLAEDVTNEAHSPAEIDRWASSCGDMVLAFLAEAH